MLVLQLQNTLLCQNTNYNKVVTKTKESYFYIDSAHLCLDWSISTIRQLTKQRVPHFRMSTNLYLIPRK